MNSRPPLFLKMKHQGAKRLNSVCLRYVENWKKWHKRWKQQCSAYVQKKPLNCKFKTVNHTLFIPPSFCFEICRNSSPCYTTHVCQPILKTQHKISDPKIFISHIPLFNFAGAVLHITPRMCANPEPTSQGYTTKPRTLRFLSHTSLFWTLPEQLSMLHHACEPTHPEPTSQNKLQISDPNFFISHIPVLNFAGTACHVTPRMWANPSGTNVPKHTTNFRSELFHLTHPCFELCLNNSEQMTPRMCANPEPMSQDTLQISIRKFSSHTSLFWTLPEQLGSDYTTHVCQPWTNVAKTHHKTSDPRIFILHIPVLNFAGTALHVTPRMCANPSRRHTTKSQSPRFSSHTSLFWTLPEQLSILHHACVPTLNQRPKDTPQNLRP